MDRVQKKLGDDSSFSSEPRSEDKSTVEIKQQPKSTDNSSLTCAFSNLRIGNGNGAFSFQDNMVPTVPPTMRNVISPSGLGNSSPNASFGSFDDFGWASPVSYQSYRQPQSHHNVQQSPFWNSNSQVWKDLKLEHMYNHLYDLPAYNQQAQVHLDAHPYANAQLPLRRSQPFMNNYPSNGYNSYRESSFRSSTPWWANYYDNHHNSSGPNSTMPTSIYAMAKDQLGCRHLQKSIEDGDPVNIKIILNEILPRMAELMTHPFGNYLVQKLIEVCNEQQLTQILYVITRNNADLLRISCDNHGTQTIQKIVQTVTTREQVFLLVSSLRSGIVTLIKSNNGSHVAQRCLMYLTPEYNEFLYEAAAIHILELAQDCYGCCVLQQCLTRSTDDQKRRLFKAITYNSLLLSQNTYGNYVVQCVLDQDVEWATMDIVDRLAGAYLDLSIQKCSSNVVEKCLKYANDEGRARIVNELLSDPRFHQIMYDPYGNYVIQAALEFSMGSLHDRLVLAITPHVHELETSPYGKKVLSGRKHKKYY